MMGISVILLTGVENYSTGRVITSLQAEPAQPVGKIAALSLLNNASWHHSPLESQ